MANRTYAQPAPSDPTGRLELVYLDRDGSWTFSAWMDAGGARHIEDQVRASGTPCRLMVNGLWDVRPDNLPITLHRCA